MKRLYIPSARKYTLLDDEDYYWAKIFTWHIGASGYAMGACPRGAPRPQNIYLHKCIIWYPNNLEIDHCNRNKLDNRKINLRVCKRAQNNYNHGRQINNTSGYKGVSWSKEKQLWRAYVVQNQHQIHLGYFPSKKQASNEYWEKAQLLAGNFARKNT